MLVDEFVGLGECCWKSTWFGAHPFHLFQGKMMGKWWALQENQSRRTKTDMLSIFRRSGIRDHSSGDQWKSGARNPKREKTVVSRLASGGSRRRRECQLLAPACPLLGNAAWTGASGELMRRTRKRTCSCGAAPIRILGGPPSHVKAWSCWAPACAWFYCVASAGLPIFKVELKESDKATICLSVALVLNVDLMLTCPSCSYPRACVWPWQEHACRLRGVPSNLMG